MPAGTLEATTTIAGGHGKLPTAADFVTFGIDRALLRTWDNWLGSNLEAGRLALGDAWSECWDRLPMWWLALAPGVIDRQPVIGLWLASSDRIGRRFPFTLLVAGTGLATTGLHAAVVPAWWREASKIARAAQGGVLPVRNLPAALQACALPRGALDLDDAQAIDGAASGDLETGVLLRPAGSSAAAAQWLPALPNGADAALLLEGWNDTSGSEDGS